MMGMKIEIVVLIGEDKLFFFKRKYFTIKFFTGEERWKFAVFIQKFFQGGYEFVTKIINFGFF